MKKIAVVVLLAGIVTGLGASTASANAPHPQPPKCVPANTPGCS